MIKEIMTSNRTKPEVDYDKIEKKEIIKNEFLFSIDNSSLNEIQKHYLKEFFDKLNAIIFAGFDYLYVDDIMLLLNKKDTEVNSKINILINKEQIDKLRTTIDCYDSLEFIDSNDQYYIWYKDTNIYCDLIPFERTNDKIIINNDNKKIKLRSKIKNSSNLDYKLIK